MREKVESSAMRKYFEVFQKNTNSEENTTKLSSNKSKEEILAKLEKLKQQSEIKENQFE